ncbi:MAG: hypothetical protein PHH68_04650 [Candidatus Omnitrophica bacterium]|nr:hypothetical protein [Candidatus Omnitrophota bacterium]
MPSTAEINYRRLKKLCLDSGAGLFGVADISGIKKDFFLSPGILPKCASAVVLGAGLCRGVLEDINGAPTRLYFHHYKIVNSFLDMTAFKLAGFIQKQGYFSLPIPATQIVDWKKQSAHLSHKKIGYLAGIGWIGRNNLLVNKELGAAFRLTCVLTDMPVKRDKPSKENCASCRSCVNVCPGKAIGERPEDFDHMKCFEQMKIFQGPRQVEQYVCGVCIKVCGRKNEG